MKVWLTCFVALFGLVELYQWVAPWLPSELPMPILIGAGVGLAIVSNSSKRAGLPWHGASTKPLAEPSPSESFQLPIAESNQQLDRPISFTIHKSTFPQEPRS